MKNLYIILIVLNINSLFAQESIERKGYTLEIADDENNDYKMEVPAGSYFVADKAIQIYCNEKVFIECEIDSDTIASMKVVMKNSKPRKTIEIEMTQNKKNNKIITLLKIKNPFNKILKYNAMMFTPKNLQWKKTSTMPIFNKIDGFEMWPHSIITILLGGWEFK